MRIKMIAAACAIFAASTQAVSNENHRLGAYDFGYATSGDLRATPVQVFDNGRYTFFQFRGGNPIPAIFVNRNGTHELLVPVHKGPFIKVNNVHGHFTLHLGRSRAQVIHLAGTRANAPVVREVAATAGINPQAGTRLVASVSPAVGLIPDVALERNSYATPVRGDRVQWQYSDIRTQDHSIWFVRGRHNPGPVARRAIENLVRASGTTARYIVIGRGDDSLMEGLESARAAAMVDALRRAGVPADRISSRVDRQGASRNNLRESHIRIEIMLPTQVARPSQDRMAAPTAVADVRTSVAQLLTAGVINRDQANVMLRRHEQAATAAAAPVLDVVPGGFTLMTSDRTIQGTVRRWAQALNYRVVWDAPEELDAPITGEGQIRAASMIEALEQIVTGLRSKGYQLDVTVHSNRVISFTPAGADAQQNHAPSVLPTAAPAAPVAPQPAVQPPGSRPMFRATAAVSSVTTDTPTAAGWVMRMADGNVQRMLDRWGRQAQWRVVWNTDVQIPILGDAHVEEPSFLAAADHVIGQAVNAGFRLRAVAHANNTLVVTSN